MNLEAIKNEQIRVVPIRQNTKKRKIQYQNPDDYIFDDDEDKEEFYRILEENYKNGKVSWRDDNEKKNYDVGKYCLCKYCKYYEPIER